MPAAYAPPSNLKVALSSQGGQQALKDMFDARLAYLNARLAQAEDTKDMYRLQGMVRELGELRSSLIISQ